MILRKNDDYYNCNDKYLLLVKTYDETFIHGNYNSKVIFNFKSTNAKAIGYMELDKQVRKWLWSNKESVYFL